MVFMVNVYYNFFGNEIVFFVGIMQFLVFDVDVFVYILYGVFGFVVGYEFLYVFDLIGCYYDQNGNYIDWWFDGIVKVFEECIKCFIEQYGNFSIFGFDDKFFYVNG